MRFLVAFVLILLGMLTTVANAQETLIVAENGQFTSIDSALNAANEGDTIIVRGGIHKSPIEINKTISLIGEDDPIIDGNGEGSLVYINAPDVLFQGFTLRNTGGTMHREDAGIIIQAPHVTVAENKLENVLFGIYFSNAPYGIARENIITGQDRELGLRGDGIRVWYSNFIQLLDNDILGSRDTLIWYTDDVTIQGNHFSQNRYGLHFMYSHRIDVSDNHFDKNSVGAFLMYSQEVTFDKNVFSYNRGASGYGIALKDMDYVTVTDNLMVGNQVGIYLDNSPSLYEGTNTISGNVLAYNDIGTTALPSVERNIFTGNNFIENLQQTSIRGREITSRNVWHEDGLGNYWSDYVGYDRNSDGIGETSYRADKLFETLTDEHPNLQLLRYSPAAQAIELTASAFPILRPQPRLVDEAPLMQYHLPDYIQDNSRSTSVSLLLFSLATFGFTLLMGVLIVRSTPKLRASHARQTRKTEDNMIIVENLVKKYGKTTILDKLNFSVQAGEAVALWGGNGAGKTTTLKCLLGLLPYEGKLSVNGIEVHKDGKAVRSAVGYVPQEVSFYDLTVQDTMRFYAGLKKVSEDRIQQVLMQVDLTDQHKKRVLALSGGMKQKLALAISLLSDPPILLLDEPTANLDVNAQHEFLRLVHNLNKQGKTIIFSSHRLEEVQLLAQRVLMLKNGQLVADASPTALLTQTNMQKWLKIWVAEGQQTQAINILSNRGFNPIPNASGFYVEITAHGKMPPLRALESANIPVEDFDIIHEQEQRS